MAVKCGHCRGTDVVFAFDTYQCLECGGYSKFDGSPTVPTSAVESEGATYDGPGAHLLPGDELPIQARQGKI